MDIGGLVKNSFVDYPNKMCCVVFTTNCNMNCWYCHNKHLLNGKTEKISDNEIFAFLDTHKQFLDAVTISGGEPTLQKDLIPFIKKVKEMGFLIKLDTNGTNYEILKFLVDNKYLDYVAMDIKAPLHKYNEVTNITKNQIDEIKKSIKFLMQNKVNYEFRTTICPNLTLKDIETICKTIKGAKNYSLQKYRSIKKESSTSPIFYNVLIDPCFTYSKKSIKYKKCHLKPVYNKVKFNQMRLAELKLIKAKEIAIKYANNVVIKGL